MAAKDTGVDVFDTLGTAAIDGGVDQAGPSLQRSDESSYGSTQRRTYDDALRFTGPEEDVFVGVNSGPWLQLAWFIPGFFGSKAGIFPLSAGKAEGWEDT
jgi:hypothetical protein